jgi:Tfp pilus assembly protein PilO
MNPNRRERLIVISTVICLAALLGDKLILPQFTGFWKERSTRIEELESSLQDGKLMVDREERIRKRWQEMRQRALPTDRSEAESLVLNSISNWAQKSHLAVKSYKPKWSKQRDESDYALLEFSASAQGRLEQIARFLYELESDQLAIRIDKIDITARDNTGSSLSLNVNCSGLLLLND